MSCPHCESWKAAVRERDQRLTKANELIVSMRAQIDQLLADRGLAARPRKSALDARREERISEMRTAQLLKEMGL